MNQDFVQNDPDKMPRIEVDAKTDPRLNGCSIKRLEMIQCKGNPFMSHGYRLALDDLIGEIYLYMENSCPDCRHADTHQVDFGQRGG